MASIMEMFHNAFGQGSNNQQQQQQNQQQTQQQQSANSNTTVPNANNQVNNQPGDPAAFRAGQTGEAASPLAQFAELWKIEPKDAPRDPVAALTPNFSIDPQKVADAAKTVDYARLVPPEVMTKALSGDAAAMSSILNTVVQASTANAGMSTANIVQAALAHQAKQFAEILPQEVRKLQVQQQVQQDNPLFSNPAAAPILEGLQKQMAAKYPTATPAQIAEHTKNYLADFVKLAGGTMNPVQTQQQQQQAGEVDWMNYFQQK